jgi:hypothetical protein
MVNPIFRKVLVFGILLLFIGLFFVPNISGNLNNKDFHGIYDSDFFDNNVGPICKNFDRIDFGDGSDGDVIISNDTILSRDMNYSNLIVNNNIELDTKGFLIKVSGTFTNYGTITDSFSGGNGGAGGDGGQGGDPWENSGGPEYPEDGLCGNAGELPIYPEAGIGGDGGGGAGGGGGAWWYLLGQEEDADGGDGGNGGLGGNGGGFVRIYAFNFNNTPEGVIHADGNNGTNGQNGEDGNYHVWNTGVYLDLAGGGGGGGAGGNGGDGGTVLIYYRKNLGEGEIRAKGGNPGNGGYGGDGRQNVHATVGGNKDSGATGACGGGNGGEGEYQVLQWSEDGEDGSNGASGFDGTVIFEECPNQKPNDPIIGGPHNGKPGIEYEYTFTSIDPDLDDVIYYINWGDDLTDITDYYQSGEPVTVSHIWTSSGNYTIQAKAIDIHGDESNWTILLVTIPRNKVINNVFLKFFQQNLNLFPILQKLLKDILM